MRIFCWQMIPAKYHTLFFSKYKKDAQKLSSAAVVIAALKDDTEFLKCKIPEAIDQ